jgi:hypothetical protein
MKAFHPGMVEAHPELVESHFGAIEAHPRSQRSSVSVLVEAYSVVHGIGSA